MKENTTKRLTIEFQNGGVPEIKDLNTCKPGDDRAIPITQDILARGLENLDADIDRLAINLKGQENGPFIWSFSYYPIRNDGFQGLAADYIIVEFIRTYLRDNGEHVIFIHFASSIPSGFRDFLLEEFPTINFTFTSSYNKRFIRHIIGPLFRVLKDLLYSLFIIRRNNSIAGKCLVYHRLSQDQSRWNGYLDKLDKVVEIDSDLWRVRINEKTHYSQNLVIGDWPSVINRVIKIRKLRKTVLSKSQDPLNVKLLEENFFHQLVVMLRFTKWKRFLNENRLESIHMRTSYGDNDKRLGIYVASRFNLRTNILLCRPFISSYRSEDRLLNADKLSNRDGGFFETNFFFLDKYSLNKAKREGLLSSRLKIHDQPIQMRSAKRLEADSLLLLFSDSVFNSKLLQLLKDCGILNKFNKIYYRSHPSELVSQELILCMRSFAKDVVDVSRYLWSDIFCEGSLTFGCNSTSALMARDRGAKVIWLPFISNSSIVLAEFHSKDIVLNNLQDFEEYFIK